jgi:hypothetical protein
MENLKKPKNQKTKKLPTSNAVKSQSPILEMVPQMLFCSCLIKGDAQRRTKLYTHAQKKLHQVSQVQTQYSFSKFFSLQV